MANPSPIQLWKTDPMVCPVWRLSILQDKLLLCASSRFDSKLGSGDTGDGSVQKEEVKVKPEGLW